MPISFDILALGLGSLIVLRCLVRAARHDLTRGERLRQARERRLAIG
jgi:hypothetical protein